MNVCGSPHTRTAKGHGMHLTRAKDVVEALIRVGSQRVHAQGSDDTHDLVRPWAGLPTGRPVAEASAEGVPTFEHPLDEALIDDHGGPVLAEVAHGEVAPLHDRLSNASR